MRAFTSAIKLKDTSRMAKIDIKRYAIRLI